MKFLVSLICILFTSCQLSKGHHHKIISTLYRWKQMDYAFPTPQIRNIAEQSGLVNFNCIRFGLIL